MKEKLIKLGLSLATLMVFAMVSCGPEVTTTTSSTNSTAAVIPGTVLMSNVSAPTGLMAQINYEKTATAHKFYIKTTFVASNYMSALREVDARIGDAFVSNGSSGDLWGQMIICFDQVSKSATPVGKVKIGNSWISFADTNFEVDGLLRSCSDWQKPNLKDGIPLRAENGNILFNYLKSGDTNTDKLYWERADEKKWQAGTDAATAEKMISGVAGTVLTNVIETGVTNIVAVAGDNYLKYTAEAGGYYTFSIPFTLIGATDIKAISVFALQNSGWRPGASLDAVVKPLGSSKVLALAGTNGVISGIPTFKFDGSVLTTGTFASPADSMSIGASSFTYASNSVIVKVYSASNFTAGYPIKLIGPNATNTVNLTTKVTAGDIYIYSNAITLSIGSNLSTATYQPTSDVYLMNLAIASLNATNTYECLVKPDVNKSLVLTITNLPAASLSNYIGLTGGSSFLHNDMTSTWTPAKAGYQTLVTNTNMLVFNITNIPAGQGGTVTIKLVSSANWDGARGAQQDIVVTYGIASQFLTNCGYGYNIDAGDSKWEGATNTPSLWKNATW